MFDHRGSGVNGRASLSWVAVLLTILVMIFGVAQISHLPTQGIQPNGIGSAAVNSYSSGSGVVSSLNDSNSSSSYLSGAEVMTQVSDLYARFAQASLSPAYEPAAATVAATALSMFHVLSNVTAFSNLMDTVGPGGFTFSLGSDLSQGLTQVTYTFNWVTGQTTHTTYWTANLISSTLSGPVTASYPRVTASNIQSTNWAGASYWIRGSPTPYLNSAGTSEYVPTVVYPSQVPQNVPSGDYVFPMYSQWVGLTDSSSNLLQTGIIDTPCCSNYGQLFKYQVFWELFPCNGVQLTPNMPDAAPNQEFTENIYWSGTAFHWTLYVTNDNTGAYSDMTIDVQGCLPGGFHPQWSNFIVEANSYDGYIQQIAQFNDQVSFYNIDICSTTGSCTDPANAGSNYYTLKQSASSSQDVAWFFIDDTYPSVTWDDSDYNWDYVY